MITNRFFAGCAVASVALIGTALAGCGDTPTTTTTTAYRVSAAVGSIDVTSGGGRITLVPGAGDAVEVTETATYAGKRPHGGHDVRAGTLGIATVGCSGGRGACGIDYRLEIPDGLAVRLTSGGGTVDVQGTVETLEVRSGGGDVTVRAAGAPRRVDVDSAGGDTTLHLPAGPYALSTDTAGGAVTASVDTDPAAARHVRVSTGGGGLTISG